MCSKEPVERPCNGVNGYVNLVAARAWPSGHNFSVSGTERGAKVGQSKVPRSLDEHTLNAALSHHLNSFVVSRPVDRSNYQLYVPGLLSNVTRLSRHLHEHQPTSPTAAGPKGQIIPLLSFYHHRPEFKPNSSWGNSLPRSPDAPGAPNTRSLRQGHRPHFCKKMLVYAVQAAARMLLSNNGLQREASATGPCLSAVLRKTSQRERRGGRFHILH